jgi:ATP diphosphatase
MAMPEYDKRETKSDATSPAVPSGQASAGAGRLVAIMAALRTPGAGCPWDLEQSFETIVPYTLEEAYEVADAIERRDMPDLCEELGDLLLQVVFHARMAEENGAFDFEDVTEAICRKLIRRHPHVFGDARDLSPAEVKALWGQIKAAEKAEKAARHPESAGRPSRLLDGVPRALPALARALKLQAKAATVGFDWDDAGLVLDKIAEEIEETRAAIAGGVRSGVRGEIGDLMFALVNLARHLDVDPERALAETNAKFERRFGHVEDRVAASGRGFDAVGLDEMEAYWVEAKRAERPGEASDPRPAASALADNDAGGARQT